jgi:hypothetical protein
MKTAKFSATYGFLGIGVVSVSRVDDLFQRLYPAAQELILGIKRLYVLFQDGYLSIPFPYSIV